MNKKLIAAILAAATALSAAPFALAENDENTNDKVEIAFNVGDSILKINGIETEVETPYVTENNTTLVPLRVITEAFGAKVDWDGDTQKITLTYPAVNIELQIGNIVATVNDHTETLLESPALSENGVTMVPLRFISETFGATVGYDNDTQAIRVTKENMDNSSTVTGITDMTKTGDSYYLWSIDTPTQMKMADRTLDAMTTKFVADDESSIYIDVCPITEDTVDFDEEYSFIKDSLSSLTLVNAEKLPESNGIQHMHFQAKNKEEIVDLHEYYAKNYKYLVSSLIKINDDTSTKDMILSLVDSFKIGKLIRNDPEDTLTTVKVDNYQFSVPASWKPFAKSNQGISYINTYTTSGIIYSYQNNSEFKQTNLSSVANAYSKHLTQDEGNEIYKKIEYTSINGKRYAYFTFTTKSKSDSKTYGTVYITCDNGTAHIFTLIQDEVFYGSAETNDFEDIVSSLQSK